MEPVKAELALYYVLNTPHTILTTLFVRPLMPVKNYLASCSHCDICFMYEISLKTIKCNVFNMSDIDEPFFSISLS